MTTRDAKTLYQELVIEHGKSPRNAGPLAGATHSATSRNPLCGDRVTVHAIVDEAGVVQRATFEARGCMIARASASLLTETIVGRDTSACTALAGQLDALVTGADLPADAAALEPLRGVQEFPARRACVTLAWHALRDALTTGRRGPDEAPR
jgi:nitrogen fixation NifU-like protein